MRSGHCASPFEVQELVGIPRDAQEPLRHLPAGDGCGAALAQPVDHLLVGQHRLAGRAPDRRGLSAIGEARLVELEKEPLIPPVVLGKRADDLPVPVIDGADGPKLAAHLLDVAHGPCARVYALADRGVLRRQPEGIEADGVQHVVALHAAEPGVGVGRRHDVPVPNVQVPGRVRVHGQLVPLGARVVVRDAVHGVLLPALLPLLVQGPRVPPQLDLTHRRFGHPVTSVRPSNKRPVPRRDGSSCTAQPAVPPCLPRANSTRACQWAKGAARNPSPALTLPPSGATWVLVR